MNYITQKVVKTQNSLLPNYFATYDISSMLLRLFMCIKSVQQKYDTVRVCASLSKPPWSVMTSWQLDIGHSGSIYTTETSKGYKSRPLHLSPQPVVTHLPEHSCLQLSLGTYLYAPGANSRTPEEKQVVRSLSPLPPAQGHQPMADWCSYASEWQLYSRAPLRIHVG